MTPLSIGFSGYLVFYVLYQFIVNILSVNEFVPYSIAIVTLLCVFVYNFDERIGEIFTGNMVNIY